MWKITWFTILLFSWSAQAQNNAYEEAKTDGWFWYREQTQAQANQEKTKPKKNKPIVEEKNKEKEPEPFSASWVRAQIPILLDRAITNPTMENVRAYKYMERLAVDMSTNFADMSQKVVASDPMLDESVRFPISAMARSQALWRIDRARDAILKDLANKAGIWMFFDSKCAFCQSQYEALKLLADKYKIEVRYISIDGGIFSNMSKNQVMFDYGGNRAREMGVQITPATFLVVPPDRLAIVAHGAMPLSQLEQQIVTAAIDMNVTDPELTNIASLQQRGILTHNDMMKVKKSMHNPEDSDELVKMLSEMIRERM